LRENHRKEWEKAKLFYKQAITIRQLLDIHDAPKVIDYLSLDTEGNEGEIVRSFPFDTHKILTMTIESPDKETQEFVKGKGFRLVENPFSASDVDWEYHYVHESVQ
jgi:hypothetical protein